MDRLSINDIIKAVSGIGKNIKEKTIDNIVIDDRKVTQNCIFVAIKGERFDGHDFIESAIDKGVAAVITEREIPLIPQIVVEDTKRALLDIASFNRSRFSGMVVGVTGSVGKTTAKDMIAKVLSLKMHVLKTQGNLNNAIGLSRTLFGLDSSHQAAVIEMGMSNSGEISALSQTSKPTVGIITNIGVSHIENLGSRDEILKSKLEILDGMSESSPLIVGGDNDKLKNLVLPHNKVIKCGIENEECDYRAFNIESNGFDTEFDVEYKTGKTHVKIPTIGEHNVLNALFGFAVGVLAKIEPEQIADALYTYEPTGMRQNISKINGVIVIGDCYNASPDSMRAALSSLMTIPCSGRRIAVLGDMLELGSIAESSHIEIGELAAGFGVDFIYCYGDLARYIYKGALKCCELNDNVNNDNIAYFNDKETLAVKLRETIKPGDAVLFKASRAIKLEDVMQFIFK